MMDKFQMLTAREQLMEDIDCIITDYFAQLLHHHRLFCTV
jgi:hypothetical protein